MVNEMTYDDVLQHEGSAQLIAQMNGEQLAGYLIKLNGCVIAIAGKLDDAKRAFSRAVFIDKFGA